MDKRLTNPEFRKLMKTISADVKNSFYVTSHVYGSKVAHLEWNKTLAKQYVTEIQSRLSLAYDYYRYRPSPKDKDKKKNLNGYLKQTFFVFQNFKDWLSDVNMGNGFATFMIHKKPNPKYGAKSKSEKPNKAKEFLLDSKSFISFANTNLKKETSISEIYNLLSYHHGGYTTTNELKKKTFEMDGDDISKKDKHLLRMLEIVNAYRRASEVKEISVEKAIDHLVPQELSLRNGDDNFNVQDILNVDFSTVDGKQHTSAIVNPTISTIVMTLMANANRLHDQTSNGYIHYDLFTKYFGGTDKEYGPTNGVGFYLEGEDHMRQYFGLSKKRNDWTEETIKEAVVNFLGEEKKEKLSVAAQGLIARITNAKDTNYTAMDYAEEGGRKKKKSAEKGFIRKGEGDAAYGIKTFIATQFAYYNRIPVEMLSKKFREMIGKDTESGAKLESRIETVQKRFSAINEVYKHYSEALEAEQKKAEKAEKAEKAKSPKKKTKNGKAQKLAIESPKMPHSPLASSPRKVQSEGSDEESDEESNAEASEETNKVSPKKEQASSSEKGSKRVPKKVLSDKVMRDVSPGKKGSSNVSPGKKNVSPGKKVSSKKPRSTNSE